MNSGGTAHPLTVFSNRLVPASYGDATAHLAHKPDEPLRNPDQLREHLGHLRYLPGPPTPLRPLHETTQICVVCGQSINTQTCIIKRLDKEDFED
jgi:hypothetical protein